MGGPKPVEQLLSVLPKSARDASRAKHGIVGVDPVADAYALAVDGTSVYFIQGSPDRVLKITPK